MQSGLTYIFLNILSASPSLYEVLAELTSVADAVWIWATHEATLEEWDLAGMFPGNFVSKKSIFPKQVGPLYSLPPLLFT